MLRKPAILMALSVLAVNAQNGTTDQTLVTLPSAASVGNHLLQAGEYAIRQVPAANGASVLQFMDKEGKTAETATIATSVQENGASGATMVQLKCDGGEQYVSHLWIEGESSSYELPKPDPPPLELAETPAQQPSVPAGTPPMPQTSDPTPPSQSPEAFYY